MFAVLVPRAGRSRQAVTQALALAFAAAGAVSSPAPTGVRAVDALLAAALCAVTVLLSATADRWLLSAAAALAVAGTTGAATDWPAAVALGVAAGAIVARPNVRIAKPVVGGLVAIAALRFSWPSPVRASAVLAALVLGLICLSGFGGLRRRARTRVRRAALVSAGFAGVAALMGVIAATQARPAVQNGIDAATAGLQAARSGDVANATKLLDEASGAFSKARGQLDAWWTRPALAVPVVAPQSRALRAMAASGASLSEAGARTIGAVDVARLQLVDGKVALDEVVALRQPARRAFLTLAAAEARLSRVGSPWLVPPVSNRLEGLTERVTRARGEARTVMVSADVAPGLLGLDGPRRYFLAVQTPSELRASGGFIGNFGEISADRGRLTLDKVGRTDDLNRGGNPQTRRLIAPADYTARYSRFDVELLWQNITMSPDFPTVARAIAGLYPQSGGRPVDGVVAVDPIALAALLEVIGPVQVPAWPEPLTGTNAVRVLLYEQYVRLEGEARVDFLGTVTEAVWRRLTTATFDVGDLARVLGPMVAQKHVQLASTHPSEERGFLDLGVGGEMAPVRGDFLGVVTQNASASKIDWFLRRSISYDAQIDRSTGGLRSTVRINLRNGAPPSGLPDYVIGNQTEPPLPAGSNKLYLSVYTPWLLSGARIDGKQLLLEAELERNRHVYSTYVTLPPRGSSTIELDLVGEIDTSSAYRLDLHRQPFLAPDEVSLGVAGSSHGSRPQRFLLTTDRTIRAELS